MSFDLEAGRALFQGLADELSEKLYAIAKDADDETKLERATDLLEKTREASAPSLRSRS